MPAPKRNKVTRVTGGKGWSTVSAVVGGEKRLYRAVYVMPVNMVRLCPKGIRCWSLVAINKGINPKGGKTRSIQQTQRNLIQVPFGSFLAASQIIIIKNVTIAT